MRPTPSPRRAGYTLVELLVVMALIVLLAALAAAVATSGLIGSQKVVSGADRVSGWLLISKQRAMRDGAPRGVRFLGREEPAGSGYVEFREAQYIEAPEPWVPNPDQNPNGPRIVFEYMYTTTGTGATAVSTITSRKAFYVAPDMTEFDQRVSKGDYLVLPGFGRSLRILQDIPFGPAPRKELVFDPKSYPDMAAGGSATAGTQTNVVMLFGFQPAARPLLGEPTLQLTSGVVIDYRREILVPEPPETVIMPYIPPYSTATPGHPKTTLGVFARRDTTNPKLFSFDILFSPSGQVVGNAEPLICLWVRDPEKLPGGVNPLSPGVAPQTLTHNFDNAGEQALVVIYTRSGLVATQPPAPGTDPYQFAKDGINAGL